MLYRTKTDGIVGGVVGGDSVCCTGLRQTAMLVVLLEVSQCVVQD